MHGGSAHNGLTSSGASTAVGNLNNLNELWVGWNDPRAGL